MRFKQFTQCPCSAKSKTLVPFIFFFNYSFSRETCLRDLVANLFLFSFWILRFEKNRAVFEI